MDFVQKKEVVEMRKDHNLQLLHHKMVYEMEKTDVKKGLKHILVSFLKDRTRLLEFQKSWIALLFFFSFHQKTSVDYRALKSQFRQHTKMAALLRLYTSQYNQYIKKVGPTFNHRMIVNSFE